MEFGAVVSSDGPHAGSLAFDHFYDATVELGGCSGFQLADEGVARFSFDHGHDTVAVTGADDGIDLPVTEACPVLRTFRSF